MTTTRTTARHDFDSDGPCPHPNCGDGHAVSGYQCAECGHYFAPNQVVIGPDSEPYCRQGMGHNLWIDRRRAARRAAQ